MPNEKIHNDTLIIIPAYNEAKLVKKTIESIPARYPHIVCVNDGSTDETAEMVGSTRAILIKHPLNLGQGAAIQTGIDYGLSHPEIAFFVTFDADGQHQIEDVDKMLSFIQSHPFDIVLGSRFLGKAINLPWSKKIILRLGIWFSNVSTGVKLTDTHNGLRVFTREVARGLRLEMSDFAHASEIIERIHEKNYHYAELPVTILYTAYSRAKGQSLANAVNIGFDVLLRKATKK